MDGVLEGKGLSRGSTRELVHAVPPVPPLHAYTRELNLAMTSGWATLVVRRGRELSGLALALGDRTTALNCLTLASIAASKIHAPGESSRLARQLLGLLGEDETPLPGDEFWRAKALALIASSGVDQGGLLGALDALAEALSLVEKSEPRTETHLSACLLVTVVLARLLLFEAASALGSRAELAARRLLDEGGGANHGERSDLLVTELLLVRRLGEIHAVWGTHLDLLGRDAEAGRRHLAAAGYAHRTGLLARELGSSRYVAASRLLESYTRHRLQPLDGEAPVEVLRAAQAELRDALAAAGEGPDAPVEILPGRLGLATLLASEGRRSEARAVVDGVLQDAARADRQVWAGVAHAVRAEIEDATADEVVHPGVAHWRELVEAGLTRIWAERDARFADLRQRIFARDLDERREHTARELLRDPLTGLGNRRRLALELERRGVVGVLFIDVDRFKVINDQYSHAVGDIVLRRIAAILRSCSRGPDVLVRYGGDEFVVLLESGGAAAALGRRVLDRVRAEDWTALTGGHRVTVSVGAADAGSLREALARSDQALLTAKRAGRDLLVHQ